MSDDWLRAEPLWFGVHLSPEHGFLPETKKPRRARAASQASSTDTAEDGTASGSTETSDDGRKGKRRSVSADRRRKALERRRKTAGESGGD